jgi:hypothetical protein
MQLWRVSHLRSPAGADASSVSGKVFRSSTIDWLDLAAKAAFSVSALRILRRVLIDLIDQSKWLAG